MSTFAQERAFYDAVIAAESTRQTARSAAQTAYGFVQANYATFVAALVAADVAYVTAVVNAASTNGINPTLAAGGPIPSSRSSKIGGH